MTSAHSTGEQFRATMTLLFGINFHLLFTVMLAFYVFCVYSCCFVEIIPIYIFSEVDCTKVPNRSIVFSSHEHEVLKMNYILMLIKRRPPNYTSLLKITTDMNML